MRPFSRIDIFTFKTNSHGIPRIIQILVKIAAMAFSHTQKKKKNQSAGK